MVSLDQGMGHGSGRSIPGFHLARALDACSPHLLSSGGHEMAAGLRLETASFEPFRRAFAAHAAAQVSMEMLLPELHLDCQARLNQITEPLVHDLKRLGPFGTANRRPLLCCANVEVTAPPRRVGRTGDHAHIFVRQDGITLKCMAFNQGDLADSLRAGTHVDLAAEANINEYNGCRSLELEVLDVRPAQ
jgi:single-stranded-DNA-specific exonuclease